MSSAQWEQLWDQAIEAMNSRDLETAKQHGVALCELGHSAGFEVLCLAEQAAGQNAAALEWVNQGLEHAPEVWRLWQLKGICLSEDNFLGPARKAFEQALLCPDVDAASVHMNLAVVQARRGEFREALARLRELGQVQDQELAAGVMGLRLSLQRELRDHRSESAVFWDLQVRVPVVGQGEHITVFVQSVQVVADGIDEALSFLESDLGPDYAGARVEVSGKLQDAPDSLAGVYALSSGKAYFGDD